LQVRYAITERIPRGDDEPTIRVESSLRPGAVAGLVSPMRRERRSLRRGADLVFA